MMKISQPAMPLALVLVLPACNPQPARSRDHKPTSASQVVDTQWTQEAARRTQALLASKETTYELPEVRVYDSNQQLIYRQTGASTEAVAETIGAAMRARHPVAGPSYAETVGDLETADHRPAAIALSAQGTGATVFDYWASWCVPCKVLEKQLLDWAALQPRGSVRIVRAESDLTKLDRATGHKVYVLRTAPDGKERKVELK